MIGRGVRIGCVVRCWRIDLRHWGGHQVLGARVGLGPVILPFERHARAVEGDEPAVGNSDAVSVAGQVGEHSAGSAKRPFGIDDPFELSQCGNVGFEACRLGQAGVIGEELQSPSLVGGREPFQEQTAEQT